MKTLGFLTVSIFAEEISQAECETLRKLSFALESGQFAKLFWFAIAQGYQQQLLRRDHSYTTIGMSLSCVTITFLCMMKRFLPAWLCVVSIVFNLSSFAADAETSPAESPVTIFMIGDSTMANKNLIPAQPERGWGQLFQMYFKPHVRIENLAVNGRSSKSFRNEGRWKPVQTDARPGDFVIIQFGHNDEKPDAARHTEPFGSYKENLARYIREAREKGVKPIVATPIVRRAFTNQTELADTHGDYVVAVRQVAKEENVPLLDLHDATRKLVLQLGPERSKSLFMWVEAGDFPTIPNGKKDDTHLNAYGASRVCDLAVEEIKKNAPDLAALLKAR